MKRSTISNEELSVLCLELSMLFHAGVGMGDALTLLAEESAPEYKEMLSAMAESISLYSGALSSARRVRASPIPTPAWKSMDSSRHSTESSSLEIVLLFIQTQTPIGTGPRAVRPVIMNGLAESRKPIVKQNSPFVKSFFPFF